MSTNTTVNVGVLGTANIARKNIAALANAKQIQCLVVGSRNEQRAATYAAENQVPHFYGSYEQVLQDDRVQAVYLPLPTTTHAHWVAQAAAHGKHILCEKPVATNTDELVQMLALCKQANVVFMDGVMFQHHQRLVHLQEAMYGERSVLGHRGPLQLHSHFSFKGDADFFTNNIRCQAQGDPLGCLGDLGWYNVRFSLFVFQYEMPTSVRCVIHQANEAGVPYHASATMVWPSKVDGDGGGVPVADRCSTFVCSFLHTEHQNASVVGEDGFIELNDFVIPTNASGTTFRQVKHAWGSKAEKIDVQTKEVECQGDQTIAMWETFRHLVVAATGGGGGGGGGEGMQFYMEVALKTQLVVDALLESGRNGGVAIEVGALPEW